MPSLWLWVLWYCEENLFVASPNLTILPIVHNKIEIRNPVFTYIEWFCISKGFNSTIFDALSNNTQIALNLTGRLSIIYISDNAPINLLFSFQALCNFWKVLSRLSNNFIVKGCHPYKWQTKQNISYLHRTLTSHWFYLPVLNRNTRNVSDRTSWLKLISLFHIVYK